MAGDKKSADAALLNAKAVINIERPWLEVVSIVDPHKGGMAGPRFVECSNQGKTPAKIVSATAQDCFVDLPDSLPEKPAYFSPIVMPERTLIGPDDTFQFYPAGVNPDSMIQKAGMTILVEDRRKFLMLYGNVIYRDMLHTDNSPEGFHETRWCYAYSPDKRLFVRTGPKEYNSYS